MLGVIELKLLIVISCLLIVSLSLIPLFIVALTSGSVIVFNRCKKFLPLKAVSFLRD